MKKNYKECTKISKNFKKYQKKINFKIFKIYFFKNLFSLSKFSLNLYKYLKIETYKFKNQYNKFLQTCNK